MERIWYDKTRYDRAEKLYHEGLCNVSFMIDFFKACRKNYIYVCMYVV